ncbi:MAG: oligosaccharide flippase family protein [Candidatus Manganitrophus sp.]|nr:MAG: oligosaccharide flippase family protein [Candidatus Manganitrophus sp.]
MSVLLVVLAPIVLPLLGTGFHPDKLALTQSLFFILIPVLLLSGLAKIGGAVLNAGEHFAMVAVSPLVTYAVTVIVLLWAGKAWGIYALAVGTVIGFALEWGFLLWGLKRRGHPLVPRWDGLNPATMQVIRQFFPMVAGALLMSSTTFVDQAMAAILNPGSVASLNYGNRVTGVLIGLAATALGTAVIPYFSQQVAREDWAGVQSTFHGYLRLIFMISLPIAGLLFAFSEPVVRVFVSKGFFYGPGYRCGFPGPGLLCASDSFLHRRDVGGAIDLLASRESCPALGLRDQYDGERCFELSVYEKDGGGRDCPLDQLCLPFLIFVPLCVLVPVVQEGIGGLLHRHQEKFQQSESAMCGEVG